MFHWRRVFKLTLWKLVMVNKTRSQHLPKILYWPHLRQDLLRPGKHIRHNSVSKKTSAKHEVQFTAHQKMNAAHSATVLFAYLPIYCLALKKNINSNRTTLQYLSNHPEKKQWHLSKHTQKSLITSQQVRLLGTRNEKTTCFTATAFAGMTSRSKQNKQWSLTFNVQILMLEIQSTKLQTHLHKYIDHRPASSTCTVLGFSTNKNVNSHAPLITKCNASTACTSSRKKIELKNTSTFLLSQLSPLLSKNQDNPTLHLTPQPHSQLKQQQNTMVMQQMCTLFCKIPWKKTYPHT